MSNNKEKKSKENKYFTPFGKGFYDSDSKLDKEIQEAESVAEKEISSLMSSLTDETTSITEVKVERFIPDEHGLHEIADVDYEIRTTNRKLANIIHPFEQRLALSWYFKGLLLIHDNKTYNTTKNLREARKFINALPAVHMPFPLAKYLLSLSPIKLSDCKTRIFYPTSSIYHNSGYATVRRERARSTNFKWLGRLIADYCNGDNAYRQAINAQAPHSELGAGLINYVGDSLPNNLINLQILQRGERNGNTFFQRYRFNERILSRVLQYWDQVNRFDRCCVEINLKKLVITNFSSEHIMLCNDLRRNRRIDIRSNFKFSLKEAQLATYCAFNCIRPAWQHVSENHVDRFMFRKVSCNRMTLWYSDTIRLSTSRYLFLKAFVILLNKNFRNKKK
jgi:hypothetical protein